jgi:hypothetical protein
MLFKALNKKDLTLLTNRRSQSALEYMMTYGWAILIIVIVAVILYSMGIFNPSSSITTTITGFQKTPVSSAIFTDNGGLSLSVQNSVGYPIKITNITATTLTGGKVIIEPNITLLPGKSQVLVLSKVFTAANQGSHISTAVTITYKEISQQLPGPYISTGSITGSTPTVIYPANYTFAAVSKLTITNKQSSATPSPFQQMVNITSADNGWQLISNGNFGQNVEFFYSNGTVIPSWLESYTSTNAIWWLKLGSIPAGSSITVYMGIASTSTNLFNTVNDGEAPQIPCGSTPTSSCSNYAEYDDGVNVFNNYWNFVGTSLPNGLNEGGSTGISFNNGLYFAAYGSSPSIIYSTSTVNSAQIIAEEYILPYNGGDGGHDSGIGIATSGIPVYGSGQCAGQQAVFAGFHSDLEFMSNSGSGCVNQNGYNTQTSSGVLSVYSPSSAVGYAANNYTDILSYTSNIPSPSSTSYVYSLGSWGGAAIIQWLRTRAYPPNGVMPTVSFGSVA